MDYQYKLPSKPEDLLKNPTETNEVEFKAQLPEKKSERKAVLTKNLAALANSGGGCLIFPDFRKLS